MKELYLEVFSNVSQDGTCLAPVETVISLFTFVFCNRPPILLTFVISSNSENRGSLKIQISKLLFEIIDECDVNGVATNCKLPVIITCGGSTVVAGLCAVLRQVIKVVDEKHSLLGFKQSCLYACAEASLWTKFCEVDIVNEINILCSQNSIGYEWIEIPESVAKFEVHMSQPVRIHNIQKQKQDKARSKGIIRSLGLPDSRLDLLQELDHVFSEGPDMTLADVMLFPSFHIIFEKLGSVFLKQRIPLSYSWYEKMAQDKFCAKALKIFTEMGNKFKKEVYVNYIMPSVNNQSLYKGEVKKRQPKRNFYTKQETIVECCKVYEAMEVPIEMKSTTFGHEIDFDLFSLPTDLCLDDGQIPLKRRDRKGQQLQNLTKAVLKIVQNGDRIVDFCSGSGHLGLILAHILPRCNIILLENKEQSLNRARDRAAKLKLSNIVFCQSNVDYFKGNFNIGVSLHACGVATDLVMEKCILENAAFVCCPCCYGSIQPNHMILYPRSKFFRDSELTLKEYFVFGHASDQTHYDDNIKTSQGNKCMMIIDSDRCLRAKELGYIVSLSKLDPPSCTPKNNLLVGMPPSRK